MTINPQPGAVRGTVHLPYADIKDELFPTLHDKDAINFYNAKPVHFPEGTKLYRVYGGGAHSVGSYWSPTKLSNDETEAEWRSSEAVALSWNSGIKQCVMTVFENGMDGWQGEVASQPAQDDHGHYLSGYVLKGEGEQVKIMFPEAYPYKTYIKGYYEIIDAGPTPWATNQEAKEPRLNAGPKGQLMNTKHADFRRRSALCATSSENHYRITQSLRTYNWRTKQ